MKWFVILLLTCSSAFAQEVISDFNNDAKIVINEQMRKSRSDVRDLRAAIDGIETVPQGIIVMWSGSIANIPLGWELSDGSCSIACPDLRDRFIVGATQDESSVAKTNVTGSLSQTGDGTLPAHSHSVSSEGAHSHTTPTGLSGSGYYFIASSFDGGTSSLASTTNSTGAHGHTVNGGGSGTKVIAVYYALAFIIKT